MNQSEPTRAAKLRRDAEERLAGRRTEPSLPEEGPATEQLVFELQVQAVELELLGEELDAERAEHTRQSLGHERAATELMRQLLALQNTVDSVDSIVFSIDQDYRYVGFNAAHASNMRELCEAEIRIGERILDYLTESEDRGHLRAQLERALSGELVETELVWNRGRYEGHCFHITSSPMRIGDGTVVGVVTWAKDLTEQKRAREALLESEARYRALFQDSLDGVFVTSPEGRILDISRAGIAMFGYDTKEELLRLDLATEIYADPVDRDWVLAAVQQHGTAEYEVRVRRKSGEVLLTHCINSAVRDADGNIICYRGVIRDITGIRRAEEELRRAQRWRTILDRITNVFLMVPDDGMYGEVLAIILEVLESRFGAFGFIDENGDLVVPSMTREIWNECEVPGKSIVFPRDTWGDSLWGRAIREKRTFYSQGPFTTPAGHIAVNCFLTAAIVYGGQTIGVLSVANSEHNYSDEDSELLQNIASSISPILNARWQRDRQERERKQAEASLRASEERFRILFENSPVPTWEADLSVVKRILDELRGQGVVEIEEYLQQHPEVMQQCARSVRIIDVNRATLAMYEAASRTELADELARMQQPEAHALLQDMLLGIWNEQTEIVGDVALRTLKGKRRQAIIRSSVCPGYEKTCSRVLASAIDVTEARQAEQALRDSEARFRKVVNEAAPAVIAILQGNQTRFMNAVGEQLTGYNAAELSDIGWSAMVRDDFKEFVRERNLARQRGEAIGSRYDVPITAKNGEEHWFDLSVTSMEYEGKPAILAVGYDITERKRVEEALERERTLLRTVIDNLPHQIWIKDAKSRYALANIALAQSHGMTDPELLIGSNDFDYHPPELAQRLYKIEQELLRTGRPQLNQEEAFIGPDGQTRWMSSTKIPLRDRTGGFDAIVGIARDVTEHRQADEERLAHLRLLECLDQVNRAMQGTNDLQQMIDGVLDAIPAIFDCDEAWLVCPFASIAPPRHVSIVCARQGQTDMRELEDFVDAEATTILSAADSQGDPVALGVGSEKPLPAKLALRLTNQSLLAMAIYPRKDEPCLLGMQRSVHPRAWTADEKRLFQEIGRRLTDSVARLVAYRELQESESRYREVFDNVSDALFVLDVTAEGRFRVAGINPAAERLSGISNDSVCRKHVDETKPPGYLAHQLPKLRQCVETGAPLRYEEVYRTSDTGPRHVDTTILPVRGATGLINRLVVFNRDITEQKQAEESLRAASVYNRSLIEAALDPLVMIGPDGKLTDANRATELVTGVSRDQLIGSDFSDYFTEPDRAREGYREVFAAGFVRDFPLEILHREGQVTSVLYNASLYRNEQGDVVGVFAAARDITERKRAEEEREQLLARIQAQAHQIAQIVEAVPEGVLLLDSFGLVLLANATARRDMLTLAHLDGDGRLTHLGDRPLASLLTTPPHGLWHEIKIGQRTIEVIARPIANGRASEHWVLVIADVTQARAVRAQLEQQERLAAVGQLAAGIAHDFNNILAVITLLAPIVARSPDLSQRDRERLTVIREQSQRASQLVQQILDFSRRAVLERQTLDLLPLLTEQMKLLGRMLPESIRIESDWDQGEYSVYGDPTRMQQMIMNLAVNARDAMPQGGTLLLALARQSTAPRPDMADGPFIRLSVADTGAGIRADVLPHIFEPFFTTKPRGQGTGLGLAQVYGIVKQHDGEIEVDSIVGEGTTFTIYLPASSHPERDVGRFAAEDLPRGAGETILIVEDNPALLDALSDLVESLGYRVERATNGQAALERIAAEPEQISLVLSDLVMPVLGGRALLNALRDSGSDVPVVLMSGHPQGQEVQALRARGLNAWMTKPVDAEQIARVLAKALATPKS